MNPSLKHKFIAAAKSIALTRGVAPRPSLLKVCVVVFLATASDDSDDLTWAPDYQQVLRARDAARRREAARRLDAQEPVEMDPHLAAEAERVHQAVVAASSEGEGARPLPSLPPLR